MNNVQSNVSGILMQEKERLHNLSDDISKRISSLTSKALTHEDVEINGEIHQISTFHPEILTSEELENYKRLSKTSKEIKAMNFVFDNWCMQNSYPDAREGQVLLTKEEDVKDITISVFDRHLDAREGGRINVCGQMMAVPSKELSYEEYKQQYIEGLGKILGSQMVGLSVEEQNQVIQTSCSEVITPPISKGRFGR